MRRGWNTWSAQGINRISHLEQKLEVIIAVYDRKNRIFIENFGVNVGQPLANPPMNPKHVDLPNLGKVKEVGNRDLNLNYASAVFQYGNGTVEATYGTVGDNLIIQCVPEHLPELTSIYLIISYKSDSKGQIDMAADAIVGKSPEGCFAATSTSSMNEVGCFSKAEFVGQYLLTSGALNNSKRSCKSIAFMAGSKESVEFVISLGNKTEGAKSSALDLIKRTKSALSQAEKVAKESQPILDAPGLEGTMEALTAALNWNLSFSQLTNRPFMPVCKSWVEMIENIHDIKDKNREGPLTFAWDSAFSALIASSYSHEVGKEIFEDLLAGVQPDGRLPQFVVYDAISDRSNPPIFALVGLKLYRKTGDKAFLARIYPKLKDIYGWFKKNRDRNEDLLMEWGTDPKPAQLEKGKKLITISGLAGAYHESGMDDSPMWEDAELDDKHNTMDMGCVDLSALHTLSALCLSHMAKEMGEEEDAQRFISEYSMYKEMIDKYLWDQNRRIYVNRRFDGKFSATLSPTSFYPLIAKIPALERAHRLIREHLMNPDEFWGEMVIPSVPRNHTAYDGDGDYWRGRIWPPLNYLVHHGLMEYDRMASSEFAFKSSALLAREWREMRHAHENYSGDTGWGESKPSVYSRSCRLYSWAGLLGLCMIEEMIDVNLSGGLSFGCMNLPYDMSISNIPIGQNKYSVKTGPSSLEVHRDSSPLLRINPSADIYNFVESSDGITMKAAGQGPTKFSVALPFDGQAQINGAGAEIKGFINDNLLEFSVYLTDEPVSIKIQKV